MSIVLFIDSVRYSPIALERIAESKRHIEKQDHKKAYFVHITDRYLSKNPDRQTLSRFLGKRIIKALPKEKSGI